MSYQISLRSSGFFEIKLSVCLSVCLSRAAYCIINGTALKFTWACLRLARAVPVSGSLAGPLSYLAARGRLKCFAWHGRPCAVWCASQCDSYISRPAKLDNLGAERSGELHQGLKMARSGMRRSDMSCLLSVVSEHARTLCVRTCVRARGRGFVCMCQTAVYLWASVPRGEREGRGCSAGWRSDTMQQQRWASERHRLPVPLRPGYHPGTLSGVVSPTCCVCLAFIYESGEGAKT